MIARLLEPRRLLLAAAVAATLAVVPSATAGPVLVAKSDFVQSCAGTSQQCGQPIPLPFTLPALSPIQVDYLPHPAHCSDVQLTISVDGVARAPERIAPGGSARAVFGPLAAGPHELLVDATGIVGGCNTGVLGSWGGSLTVRAADGLPADVAPESELAYDGKQFLIRVKYRIREAALQTLCAAGCKARVEIRNRTGRRIYASSIKGDGKLVLGRKQGITLKPGKRLRIDIPVSKAKLLKATFTTSRKYRRAETRLRVVLATPAGEVVTIRDGAIAVSIARIESGALPGLQGILAL